MYGDMHWCMLVCDVRGCVQVCMGVCRCAQVCEDMLWASARVAACVDVCNVHGCGCAGVSVTVVSRFSYNR